MSDPRDDATRRILPVTRVGGGTSSRSARLGAIAVVGVLAAVVWAGISGRTTPVTTAPGTNAIAALPTGRTSPGASEPTPSPKPTPDPDRVGDAYGVNISIGGYTYTSMLEELRPGFLSAMVPVGLPVDGVVGTLFFMRERTSDYRSGAQMVGKWDLALDALNEGVRQPVSILDTTRAPRPKSAGGSAAALRGFHLSVYAQNDLLFGRLLVEIEVGPRTGITGDDGLNGWPGPPVSQ